MDSSSRRLSSQLKVTTPSKRSVNRRSSLANFMGGGNNDFFADAQIISFISSHKPDAKFPVSVGKICSFSLLKSSYFPVGSFAVCCKTNSIGICQVVCFVITHIKGLLPINFLINSIANFPINLLLAVVIDH